MKAYLVYETVDDDWTYGPPPTKAIAVSMDLKTVKEYISKNSKRYLDYEELEIIND